jgi:hypothetical protein
MTQFGSFSTRRGGVGKTTTSVNLAAALGEPTGEGRRFIIDMDDVGAPPPEGSAIVRLAVAPRNAEILGSPINAAAYWSVLPYQVRDWADAHGCGRDVTDPIIYLLAEDAVEPHDLAVYRWQVEVVAQSAATQTAHAGRYVVYPLDGDRDERWVCLQVVSTGAARLVELGEDGRAALDRQLAELGVTA